MVWGFVGAIGTTLTIFILPPAFYLRVRHHPERPDLKQIAAWCLMIVGIIILLVCTYQSIMNVVQPIEKNVPDTHVRPTYNTTFNNLVGYNTTFGFI